MQIPIYQTNLYTLIQILQDTFGTGTKIRRLRRFRNKVEKKLYSRKRLYKLLQYTSMMKILQRICVIIVSNSEEDGKPRLKKITQCQVPMVQDIKSLRTLKLVIIAQIYKMLRGLGRQMTLFMDKVNIRLGFR